MSWGKAILTVVCLFLSILFLAFEGKIRVFPLDNDIEVILYQA
ncbi:MAG: hypothetical protein ACO2OY_01165 [Thermodesulfobacteriaceae bacterium]